jgi:hypothetical protein
VGAKKIHYSRPPTRAPTLGGTQILPSGTNSHGWREEPLLHDYVGFPSRTAAAGTSRQPPDSSALLGTHPSLSARAPPPAAATTWNSTVRPTPPPAPQHEPSHSSTCEEVDEDGEIEVDMAQIKWAELKHAPCRPRRQLHADGTEVWMAPASSGVVWMDPTRATTATTAGRRSSSLMLRLSACQAQAPPAIVALRTHRAQAPPVDVTSAAHQARAPPAVASSRRAPLAVSPACRAPPTVVAARAQIRRRCCELEGATR